MNVFPSFEAFQTNATGADTRLEPSQKNEKMNKMSSAAEQKEDKTLPTAARIEARIQKATRTLALRSQRIAADQTALAKAEQKAKNANRNTDMITELTKDAVIPGGIVINQEETKTLPRTAPEQLNVTATQQNAVEVPAKQQAEKQQKQNLTLEKPIPNPNTHA